MQNNLRAGLFFNICNSADVVEMAVGTDDVLNGQILLPDRVKDHIRLIAWVYNHRLTRHLVADDMAVYLERPDNYGLNNHAIPPVYFLFYSAGVCEFSP